MEIVLLLDYDAISETSEEKLNLISEWRERDVG